MIAIRQCSLACLRFTAKISVLCAASLCVLASAAPITVLVSDDGAANTAAARSFKETIEHLNARAQEVTIVTLEAANAANGAVLRDSTLVVSVGSAAARAAFANAGTYALLSIVIPKQVFQELQGQAGNGPRAHASAIYLDQPLGRQLNLIQAAFPGRRRAAVVLGSSWSSRALLTDLRGEAAQRGITIVSQVLGDGDGLFPALQKVLPESDLLLAVPDRTVLTPASARSVLVSAYRYQVPVVAFSENYVKAGAIIAVYSTPEQIGRQAAEMAAAFQDAGTLPTPHYPKYFSVAVNYQVARSLGMSLADEQTLHSQLAGMRE